MQKAFSLERVDSVAIALPPRQQSQETSECIPNLLAEIAERNFLTLKFASS